MSHQPNTTTKKPPQAETSRFQRQFAQWQQSEDETAMRVDLGVSVIDARTIFRYRMLMALAGNLTDAQWREALTAAQEGTFTHAQKRA